ncbi:MAG TPA: tetraacyldisaccharide 4'-kinase [Flavobacteriaceae bacterium]|nr:tetraacyldisaccharide 4'-kinase [Flavobacteriaceae bacterium]MCB9213590.1 tetraacyldisaccharide 4'-kinase [Alteromonas sp.]HPF12091.1 tetraacyldisaccharide 4'-kinase [Flavobacteriaceae bacterium]HQU21478.1 tetraacyldisaccharide 4'-kinase [Flavobacteriaceae bacterium]HQU65628.1 tetraacyldisaccharide 4'-kinase [Flavobacteriaceae bacterium]
MKLRKILYPFSVLYDGITRLRNLAYDKEWKDSNEFEIPVISVGNLSVGGTGKSPMIELLVETLMEDYRVAVLSRGYKRNTKGFLEVQPTATASEVGDEPLQFKQKFPQITVAVCADRREGIERLKKHAEVILLDDAFQHRKVVPAMSILLTAYDQLFLDDCLLPAGNLRESRKGMDRANSIVVTKCPNGVAYAALQKIQFRMQLKPHQSIYFSEIRYDSHIHGKTESLPLAYLENKKFTLVTGIANPEPLLGFLKGKGLRFEHQKFRDHHHFTDKEINQLQTQEIILTTEKDFQRLKDRLDKKAMYYLPIKTKFLYKEEGAFRKEVLQFLEDYRKG